MRIEPHFIATAKALTALSEDAVSMSVLDAIAKRIVATKRSGGCVYSFGNGGSAADAAHFCGELAGWYEDKQRPAISAIDLAGQIASLTAVANDQDYTTWPSRFLRSRTILDMVVFLTTSGKSRNVMDAVDVCLHEGGPFPVLICGQGIDQTLFLEREAASIQGGRLLVLVIESLSVPVIQEVMKAALHHICARVDALLKET